MWASARFLECKLDEQGKRLIKIGGWLPSGRTRSPSGAKKGGPPLPERTRACSCGNILDRGINAAINIKNETLRMLQHPKIKQPRDTRGWLVECLRR
ncbi:MAG: transposase [Clostridiales bacterium]|nr:transposase [Clostridiales bacterium]